jgi:hypothetical protein
MIPIISTTIINSIRPKPFDSLILTACLKKTTYPLFITQFICHYQINAL